ncbi:putative TIM-barrel fold metal-dependent hydrolase [Mycolicibacterium chubuense NBB4]|uniref:Putative TIM-barrel fold metal-dependent hydrolase n=1 Tax=Mycolicibacterium chubuense (strain NBB4) TaxID=710421 RepID=I4BIC0_MYCCN|nr:amidohydrolase family protein [Mycolicibacterium chubuense]AFM17027.1 putative TIM-barrel fold metal-dependent hydrolase [Mycolicibacterium chubuense NBB4]
MAPTDPQNRATPVERAAVRCVDSDVHPMPRRGELLEYLPEPWRSRYFLDRHVGEQIFYDAPDYAHAYAMRTDTFPADGEFAGSDPDLMLKQLIMEAGADIAILEPLAGGARIPEASQASSVATNEWLARHWLDTHDNWHQRWRGSICVTIEDPDGAVAEIEKWAGHPYMAQILIRAEPRPSWGHPRYDPIWAAATKHDITVACHLGRGHFETLPMPPVGLPSYNHDFMVSYSLTAANQVMSLIFDGVFDRFPALRIVFVEHAFTWILPLMWRMDAIYDKRRQWLDIKRKPSDYVKDHIKFTTQPLDYPEDKTELSRAFEWMECEKILLFSSDYPHWTFDDPRWLVKHLPEHAREAVMFKNGIQTYKLPETVPALEGQTRVF